MAPTDVASFAAHNAPIRPFGRMAKGVTVRFDRGGRELVIFALGLALLGALHVGGMISDRIGASTPWLVMACLTLPMAVVSAIFWVLGHVLSPARRPTSFTDG